MAEINKVVAHALNGKTLKGTTQDFFPNRPLFHISPMDGSPAVEVRTRSLKAAFFVKTYEGDSTRRDTLGFLSGPGETSQGKKLAVRFQDGELLCGYSLSYSPDREGFFMFPADSGSNNIRIYVVTASTVEITAGASAEAVVQRAQEKNRAA